MMKQPSSATGMQIRRTSLKPGETARAYTGEQSIIQPQILPRHQGTSAIEVLASINDGERREGYEVVRETWNSDNSDNFERIWQQILHDGISANAGYSAAQVTIAASLGTEISGGHQRHTR